MNHYGQHPCCTLCDAAARANTPAAARVRGNPWPASVRRLREFFTNPSRRLIVQILSDSVVAAREELRQKLEGYFTDSVGAAREWLDSDDSLQYREDALMGTWTSKKIIACLTGINP